MSDFSNKLKELRKLYGLSQVELANKLDLRQSNITNWECYNREPLPDNLLKIADFFHVSVDYLLGRENEDFTKNYSDNNTLPLNTQRLIINYSKLDSRKQKLIDDFVQIVTELDKLK